MLHEAASAGDQAEVERLLAAGAEIHALDFYSSTPLHEASHGGHLEVVRLLLKRGAEIDMTDCFHSTPLHHACYGGHLEVVRELILRGANRFIENNDGKTPAELTTKPELRALFEPVVKSAN